MQTARCANAPILYGMRTSMVSEATLSLCREEASTAVTVYRYRPRDRTDRSVKVGDLSGVSVSRWGGRSVASLR